MIIFFVESFIHNRSYISLTLETTTLKFYCVGGTFCTVKEVFNLYLSGILDS